MNILDRVIAPFSPQRALNRALARKRLEALEGINNLDIHVMVQALIKNH